MHDSLAIMGWTITEDGWLTTQDALLSEQFFPPGTYYDACIAIRDILAKATTSITVVDAYVGNTLFTTLSALPACAPLVSFLSTDRALKPDFKLESSNFQKQHQNIRLQVRTTQDFHDRFVVIDGRDHYHVDASIKDAGRRAFLISKLEDAPIIAAVTSAICSTWNTAKTVI